MKKTYFIILVSILACISVFSQENNISMFKPSGKPYAKIFNNFHSGLSENNNNSEFQITRAYLGYLYNLSTNFSTKIVFDIGNPTNSSKYERTAYVKNAYLTYYKKKISVNFGLIGLIHTPIQEKSWGHRYICQSFMNQYGFVSTADMGVSASYTFNKKLKLDAIVFNGEGYKKLQADSTYRGGFGLTFNPARGITIRFIYDMSFGSSQNQEITSTLGGFIEYKYKNSFLISAEYDIQNNHKFIKSKNLSGISVYASYNINKKFEVFSRFDQLSSNTIQGENEDWNIMNNGSFIIGGVQFAPIKGVKIALNYQNWIPVALEKNNEPSLYLNIEYKY